MALMRRRKDARVFMRYDVTPAQHAPLKHDASRPLPREARHQRAKAPVIYAHPPRYHAHALSRDFDAAEMLPTSDRRSSVHSISPQNLPDVLLIKYDVARLLRYARARPRRREAQAEYAADDVLPRGATQRRDERGEAMRLMSGAHARRYYRRSSDHRHGASAVVHNAFPPSACQRHIYFQETTAPLCLL
jgi:hypothetical protein